MHPFVIIFLDIKLFAVNVLFNRFQEIFFIYTRKSEMSCFENRYSKLVFPTPTALQVKMSFIQTILLLNLKQLDKMFLFVQVNKDVLKNLKRLQDLFLSVIPVQLRWLRWFRNNDVDIYTFYLRS